MDHPFPHLTRRELLIALGLSLLAVLLANLPILVGYLFQGNGWVYTGASVAARDYFSYLSKINEGQNGGWLFHLAYTSQNHPGAPVYLYYLALGHLSALLGWSAAGIYQAARVCNALILLISVYLFTAFFFEQPSQRRTAFLITLFSSGLGWLLMFFGRLDSIDLAIPESNTFYSLMAAAHFALAQAAMIWLFILLLLPPARGTARKIGLGLSATACAALLMVLQPFMAAIVLPVAGLYFLYRWWREKRLPLELFLRAAAAGLTCLLLAAWTYTALQADPLLARWMSQNQTPSPPVWDTLAGYGLVLALAVFGVAAILRRRDDSLVLPILWVLVAMVGMYAPTVLQRRLSLGLHIPLALLAAVGLLMVWTPRWQPAQRRRNTALVIAAAALTSLLLVISTTAGMLTHDPRVSLTHDEAAALAVIDAKARPMQVVLSSDELGGFIPAFTHQRVVCGHDYETPDYQTTRAQVAALYSGQMTPTQIAAQLSTWGVDYLLVGPREEKAGRVDWSSIPGLQLVDQFGSVRLYRRLP